MCNYSVSNYHHLGWRTTSAFRIALPSGKRLTFDLSSQWLNIRSSQRSSISFFLHILSGTRQSIKAPFSISPGDSSSFLFSSRIRPEFAPLFIQSISPMCNFTRSPLQHLVVKFETNLDYNCLWCSSHTSTSPTPHQPSPSPQPLSLYESTVNLSKRNNSSELKNALSDMKGTLVRREGGRSDDVACEKVGTWILLTRITWQMGFMNSSWMKIKT